MSDGDLVRVRTATGYETTTSRVHAEASKDLTILDEPATTGYGMTRPITRTGGRVEKPKTTVAKQAAGKKAAAARPTTPEAVTPSADDEGNHQ